MKLKKILLLTLIFVLAIFTRLFFLSKIPTSLTQDEVAIGYNAYSILKTARDEWGQFLPGQFRSVGDYKLPVLVYLTVPFIWIFGKTELAVRLPVALTSILTLYVYYQLSLKHIFSKKKKNLAALSTLLLTISPWHIFFSRSGFEAILGLLFSLLFLKSTLDFLKSNQVKNFWLMVSFGFLAVLSYHSIKIFAPLLFLSLLINFYNQWPKTIVSWWKNSKPRFLVSLLILPILFTIFVSTYIFGIGATRAKMTILYNDFDYARVLVPLLKYDIHANIKSIFLLIFFWFKRFTGYFQPNFYLSSGLGLTLPGQPGQGVIYAIEFVFLIWGGITLLSEYWSSSWLKASKQTAFIIFSWLILGFLPASLANNSQHALRSLIVAPAIYWLVSLGILSSFQYFKTFKKPSINFLFISIVATGYVWGIVRFLDNYLVHYPQQLAEHRQYGWKEVALFANQHAKKFNIVYVDPRFGIEGPYNYGVPYLYFLFYSNQDPAVYNQDPRRLDGNSNFNNFRFEDINWFGVDHSQNNLYVASPWSFPLDQINKNQILFKIFYPNGKLGLMVIKDRKGNI